MSEPAQARPGWYPAGDGHRYWDGTQWTTHWRPAEDRRHRWWLWSPAYSVGVVAFVPAVHAAIKLGRRDLWTWAGGLVAGDVVVWVLLSGGSSEADAPTTPLESVAVVLALVLAVLGTTHAFKVREEVFGGVPAVTRAGPVAAKDDPAVQRAQADRRRRADSVALVAKDPGLARDLRVGRPDLARDYDDGGLVDVNHAPTTVLVSHLGLTEAQARTVVEVREAIDGFESADDLILRTDLPPRALDAVRDRVVTL